MKFCCERFKSYYEDNTVIIDGEVVIERYPLIKIVRLKEVRERPYRYFFVTGLLKNNPPVINMAFCPFCGKDLFKFYKHDDYVNADNDVFGGGLDV